MLTQIKVSVKVENNFKLLKSKLPCYVAQPVSNCLDLIGVDTHGDGVYDTRLK